MATTKLNTKQLRSLVESEVKKTLREFNPDEPGGGVPTGLDRVVRAKSQDIRDDMWDTILDVMNTDPKFDRFINEMTRVCLNEAADMIKVYHKIPYKSGDLSRIADESDAAMNLHLQLAEAFAEFTFAIVEEYIES